LALAIVSFSCTGPIVGTLLVEAASKIAPIIGMFGFHWH
jgi:thiol:disulfide interchange protein DsbD